MKKNFLKFISVFLLGCLAFAFVNLPYEWPFVFGFMSLPHLTIAYSLLIGLLIWRQKFLYTTLLLPALLFAFWNLQSVQIPYSPTSESIEPSRYLRVVSLNIWKHNQNKYASLDSITADNPDVIVLQEIDQDSWGSLEAIIVDAYPYRKRAWNGVVIISMHPFAAKPIEAHEAFPHSFVEAAGFLHTQIQVQQDIINVVAIHTNSSRSNDDIEKRHRQLYNLTKYLASIEGQTVVAGDFNMPFWDRQLVRFLKSTNLEMPKISWFYGSWPQWLPGFLRTRFDYIFTKNLEVESFKTLPDVGSDHAPVIARIKIN